MTDPSVPEPGAVSGTAIDAGPAATRRERRRQQTLDEILATARRLIRAGEDHSLRAIATSMGMTAPALYRYVDGATDLTLLVGAAIYDDIRVALEDAAARHDSPRTQLIAASIAFRTWALAHPEEYVTCFANATLDRADDASNPCLVAGERFRGVFLRIFVQLWHTTPFEVVPDDEIDEVALEAAASKGVFADEHEALAAARVPAGAHWAFVLAWVRLYGVVTLEVFGHVDRTLIDSGVVFLDVMRSCGELVGIDRGDGAMLATLRDEMARANPAP